MPQTTPTGQKLRNSCDSCNLAKVKCSKGRPSCTRCEIQGVQCIYGISMRAGKHRAAGSNIQKPKPEPSVLSRQTTKEPTPPSNYSEVKAEPYDSTVASMIEQMPTNGDWSSILAEDCNQYMMTTGMDVDNDAFNKRQYSGQFSDDFAVQSPSDLSLDPSHLMNQNFFRASPQTYPDYFENRTLTNSSLTSTSQSQTNSRRGSPTSSCSCNQKILQHLLQLSSIPEISSAYDEALNQNKLIINLCHNILEDQSHHHHDISFVLTLTALIAKVISVYDAIYNPYKQPNPNQNGLASLTTDHLATFHDLDMASEQIDPISMSAPSSAFPTRPNTPPFSSSLNSPQHNQNSFPMRLTLGTYRLDQKDEEKLKWDIFKIELSKVGQLLRAFEQRYCDGGAVGMAAHAVQEPSKVFEAKAYEDMVYYCFRVAGRCIWGSARHLKLGESHRWFGLDCIVMSHGK